MRKDTSFYQHFAPEERDFVEKIMGICQQVEETYSYHLTAFLNPREEEIVQALVPRFQLSVFSSRQILPTEFVRVIIAPDYYELDEADFEMTALRIDYPRKFHTLTHSQILGTLLNQLGIRREFLGDILLDQEQACLILEKKFAALAQSSISKISRVPISWQEIPLASVPIQPSQDGQTCHLLLSSLRLDKFISAAFKLSRTSALKLIEGGQVKVNYREVKQAGKTIELGQLLSVRGFGRVGFREIVGYSKQGKIKVEIDIIKK